MSPPTTRQRIVSTFLGSGDMSLDDRVTGYGTGGTVSGMGRVLKLP